MWLHRMREAPPFIDHWLGHQRRDDYWKQGSVCEDFSRIEVPVYAVGGWADGYTNAIPRLLEGLPGPRKGLIGPWAHAWPQAGPPEPTIGFLQEVVRWFDHWLRGIDTGIMDEPMLRAWIHEPVRPAACYTERPGRWVAEDGWPRDADPPRTLALGGDGRLEAGGTVGRLQIVGRQTAGLDAGSWCPYGEVADWPGDQRAMDGMSLTFTSDPLPERLEILGYPEATLRLESDRPLALVDRAAVRGVARRRVHRRHARAPEPDPPRERRAPGARSSRASRSRRRSGSTRPGTRSLPGTASASGSRRPTGRGPGPRPSR